MLHETPLSFSPPPGAESRVGSRVFVTVHVVDLRRLLQQICFPPRGRMDTYRVLPGPELRGALGLGLRA
ncbi:hypothetical protein EYF80_066965 [Liparis tanakae]|uniref:Uncharacterized protein n=1 Tax=Liparis tanakae TaxID=230148 RepID=A0A4Z2E2C1_9TELE|nr:hypothetical protein EYF80_066965 [Liparis tanakae]